MRLVYLGESRYLVTGSAMFAQEVAERSSREAPESTHTVSTQYLRSPYSGHYFALGNGQCLSLAGHMILSVGVLDLLHAVNILCLG